MHKIKLLYRMILFFLLMISNQVHSTELIHPDQFYGEVNLRALLLKKYPKLKCHCHFYDGDQIISLMEDNSKKVNNMLLIVTPDYSIVKFTIFFNGRELQELKAKPLSFKIGVINKKTNTLTGETKDDFVIGKWFTVTQKDVVKINISLARGDYKCKFSTYKDVGAKWKSTFGNQTNKNTNK